VLGSLAIPGFTYSVVVGGMDMISQALDLNKRPHVIIATPGRLVDHIKSGEGEVGRWNLRRCKFLVGTIFQPVKGEKCYMLI
jgi:ATP-dependent RNA helicase DDX49/DBP8